MMQAIEVLGHMQALCVDMTGVANFSNYLGGRLLGLTYQDVVELQRGVERFEHVDSNVQGAVRALGRLLSGYRQSLVANSKLHGRSNLHP